MTNRLVADDVVEQSRQVLEVIKQEGVAIIPLDVAYAIVGNSKKSIETIFKNARTDHLRSLLECFRTTSY